MNISRNNLLSFTILVLASVLFLIPENKASCGPPWVKYNVGFNYIFRGIDFPGNQNTIGFMAGESLTYNGNGIVIKTTDGGSTWNSVWTGANMGIEGSCFVDVNTGYIAGWPNTANGWSGFGKTTNGGTTWTSIPVATDLYYFTDVVFKDASNGIVIGATNTAAVVYVTSNGGTSWTLASGASNGFPQHACHVSGNTYFLVDNMGNIKKSTNNGLTWTTSFTIPGLWLVGVEFFNDNIGMACGDNGVIVSTSDGGNTWSAQQLGTDIWHDFAWESPTHLFACGTPELVVESTNSGTTWINAFPQSSYQAALYECILTEDGHGFICGSQGTLLKRMPSCTALFSASATGVCAGDPVSFTNQSLGNISTYQWYFEGGTPSSSVNPNPPDVTYNSPGTYDVKLIVNNGYWSDTLLKADYITVSQVNTPVINAVGYLLSSNVSTGNQWYRQGTPIAGATSQSYLASQSGRYWDVVTLNGCASDTSNNIYLIMTGQQEQDLFDFHLISDHSADNIELWFDNQDGESYRVTIFNMQGSRVFDQLFEGHKGESRQKITPGTNWDGVLVMRIEKGMICKTRKFFY